MERGAVQRGAADLLDDALGLGGRARLHIQRTFESVEIADGRDVSWIWDADYEVLAGRVSRVVCAGTRAPEVAVRLKYAGIDAAAITVEADPARALDALVRGASGPAAQLVAIPTYTAMLGLREVLVARGVPLETALAPFTTNPARLLRLPNKGHIAVGMDADLVVLDAHGGVHDVICNGRWHLRASALQLSGNFEERSV